MACYENCRFPDLGNLRIIRRPIAALHSASCSEAFCRHPATLGEQHMPQMRRDEAVWAPPVCCRQRARRLQIARPNEAGDVSRLGGAAATCTPCSRLRYQCKQKGLERHAQVTPVPPEPEHGCISPLHGATRGSWALQHRVSRHWRALSCRPGRFWRRWRFSAACSRAQRSNIPYPGCLQGQQTGTCIPPHGAPAGRLRQNSLHSIHCLFPTPLLFPAPISLRQRPLLPPRHTHAAPLPPRAARLVFPPAFCARFCPS